MILKARTPRELEEKRIRVRKISRIMTIFAMLTIAVWLGVLGYSIYAQFIFDPYGDSDVHEQLPQSWAGGVFRIEVKQRGRISYGTGFSIGPSLVLTNGHVVVTQDSIVKLYTDRDKETLNGRVLWVGDYKNDQLKDIAIINIGKKPKRYKKQIFPLYRGDGIRQLDKVIALGFNLGKSNLSYLPGSVTSLSRSDKLIQHNALSNMGFSGGPLVATKHKKVIGMEIAEEDRTVGKRVVKGIGLAIPISEVLKNIPEMYHHHIGVTN